MATPIQYVQQFIPSNVGLMSEQLGQMQQRYDKAASDISNVEDLYGQLQVHPSDIAGKNAILGGFQNEIQKTVDRYGGDYGAASKDIARQITKLKQDPFFNIAAVKKARAEDEYKLRKQLGADYIPVKSVADVQVYNPETKEYASPEDIDFDYVNAKDLMQEAKDRFGDLKTKVRESKIAVSKEFPALLESTTYKGLYGSEIPKTIEDIKSSLKEKFPNAPDSYINSLAEDFAPQLEGGWTKDYRDNADYLARLRSSGNEDNDVITPIGLGSHAQPVSLEDRRRQAMEYARKTGGTRSIWDASSNGMVGSSNFLKSSDNPVVNKYMQKIVRNNPEITEASRQPLGNNTEVTVSGAGTIDLNKKYGFDNEKMSQAIKDAEKLQADNAEYFEKYRNEGLGSWWIAKPITYVAGSIAEFATNSFMSNLKNVLVDKYGLGEGAADAAVKKYSANNKVVNDKISEAWAKEADANDFQQMFNFTTIDATTKEGSSQFNRIQNISNTQLAPEDFQFRTGDNADKSPEDLVSEYKDKPLPDIIGVDGDFENGVVFVVRGPNKTKDIATLNTSIGNQMSLVEAMGRNDLKPVLMEQHLRKQYKDGDNILPGMKYRKSPNGKHVLQFNDGNVLTNAAVAQNFDIFNLTPDLNANPDDPYEFNTILELSEAGKLLLNKQ